MAEDTSNLTERLADAANEISKLQKDIADMAVEASSSIASGHGDGFLISGLTVFVLACFVGYYVVWRVTPALHSPLMAITNAISSVIIVGALLAVGASEVGFSKMMGFIAVILASINIFGGFIVTRRMLSMFKKKEAK